jgi:sialate O-acetylesterase
MKKIRIQLFVLLCSLQYISVHAAVKLPDIIASSMVLQRNTTVALWGWADAGERISIKTSWLKDPIKVTASSSGDWRINIATTDSRQPQTVSISSQQQLITLDNILFGEVWICSGQSNMEMPVSGNPGQPVFGAQDMIVDAGDAEIRLFTVEKQASLTKEKTLGANSGWKSANPQTVKGFSAIAYHFGKRLHDILKVPVGMIHSSWGGSLIEAWMSSESLGPIKEIDLRNVDMKRGNRFPTVLYNAMIHPLIPYTFKGALWYQGEGNASQPELYQSLFPAMVKDWRARWGIGDFPFYYVQIAPYRYTPQNRMDD